MLYALKTPHNLYIHKVSKMNYRSWYYTANIDEALLERDLKKITTKMKFFNKRVDQDVRLVEDGKYYWQGKEIPAELLEMVELDLVERTKS